MNRVLPIGLLAGAIGALAVFLLPDGEQAEAPDKVAAALDVELAQQRLPQPEITPPGPRQPVRETLPAQPSAAVAEESSVPPETADSATASTDPAPLDYETQLRGEDLPPQLLELLQSAYIENALGNFDQSALTALDALEISDQYPLVKPMIYGVIGANYEQLGYLDMAMEQYRKALALHPTQRTSYDAMRRLNPDFAKNHPPLPIKVPGIGKTETTSPPSPADGTDNDP